MIKIKKLLRSFKYAFKGLFLVIKEEQTFRVQLIASLIVIILMIWLRVRAWQAIVLILVIIIVLVLELINTIFERFVDMLKPRVHVYVKTIKDIMAAAVLIAALGAIFVGLLVFWPYIFR
jgi:diacylglycerol kinase